MVRPVFGVLATVLLTVCSCGDQNVVPKPERLDEAQTRDAFQHLQVTLPKSYQLVSMTTIPPAFAGGASYDGVFEAHSPADPVQIEGKLLEMSPTSCRELGWHDLPDGLDCASATSLATGSSLLLVADHLTIVAAELRTGLSHIYVRISGH
jgi:hypothetical protein